MRHFVINMMLYCGVMFLTLSRSVPALGEATYFAPRWQNEPLNQNQGIMSFEARGETLSYKTDPMQVTVKHLRTNYMLLITQPLTVSKEKQRSLYWKLPAGKYEIIKIVLRSGGEVYAVDKPRLRYFNVESFALTDLGVWLPRLQANRSLTMDFKARLVQSFYFPKGDDSIDAIIDGFSGRRLEAVGGRGHKRRVAHAMAAYAPLKRVPHDPSRMTLQYQLELSPQSKSRQDILPTVKGQEKYFRECYMRSSENGGSARFALTLARGRGASKTLSYRGGTLADRNTINCLQNALAKTEFSVQAPMACHVVIDLKAP